MVYRNLGTMVLPLLYPADELMTARGVVAGLSEIGLGSHETSL